MWPKISIITPNYNHGQFIETTINSVLSQNYPHLEYIVIDGGSTDNSLQIIEKYATRLSYWVSEKDSGQSEAINKGLRKASGEIWAWLNSDDYYQANTLFWVANIINERKKRYLVTGDTILVKSNGEFFLTWRPAHPDFVSLLFHYRLYRIKGILTMPPQPSTFFHRKLFQDIGPLRTDLHYTMDYEYWLRALKKGYSFHYIPRVLSAYRLHTTSKTQQGDAQT